MIVEWDTQRDAIRVRFAQAKGREVNSMPLDEFRVVEYADDGDLIAVELPVQRGRVDLRGVPEAGRIAGALADFPRDTILNEEDARAAGA